MNADRVHPELGMLKYDEGLNWFVSKTGLSSAANLYLSLDGCEDVDAFTQRVAVRVKGLAEVVGFAKASSLSLLPLANTEWLPQNAALRDEGAFVGKLSINSVTFYPDDSLDLEFRAGDLFAGHGVLVTVDADGNADASICG